MAYFYYGLFIIMAYFLSKKFFLDLIFPIVCLGCGREGEYLCVDCFKKLKFCAKNYSFNLEQVAEVVIAGDYEDKLLASLIKNLKFKSIKAIAKILADFLSLFWQGRALNVINPLLIPLPLSKSRERWRGFNQAELIAQEFALNFNYEINHGLKKIKHTRPQSDLKEEKRSKNIKGTFVYEGKTLFGRTIILLDDVITTGATINEAAKVLQAAGAKKIIALAVAKG